MKIFNIENGQEKVYVQVEDLTVLNQNHASCPLTIYDKMYDYRDWFVEPSLKKNYIIFDKEEEISYFKKAEWIIDYKELRDLPLEELELRLQEIKNNLAFLNDLHIKDNKMQKRVLITIKYLTYKQDRLLEYVEIRKNGGVIYLPVAPDSDGFFYEQNKFSKFVIRASITPYDLMVLRRDGNPLTEYDLIPESLVEEAIKKFSETCGKIENYSCISSETDMYILLKLKKKEIVEQEKKPHFSFMKKITDKLFNISK